jgi:hypothetical protein
MCVICAAAFPCSRPGVAELPPDAAPDEGEADHRAGPHPHKSRGPRLPLADAVQGDQFSPAALISLAIAGFFQGLNLVIGLCGIHYTRENKYIVEHRVDGIDMEFYFIAIIKKTLIPFGGQGFIRII